MTEDDKDIIIKAQEQQIQRLIELLAHEKGEKTSTVIKTWNDDTPIWKTNKFYNLFCEQCGSVIARFQAHFDLNMKPWRSLAGKAVLLCAECDELPDDKLHGDLAVKRRAVRETGRNDIMYFGKMFIHPLTGKRLTVEGTPVKRPGDTTLLMGIGRPVMPPLSPEAHNEPKPVRMPPMPPPGPRKGRTDRRRT